MSRSARSRLDTHPNDHRVNIPPSEGPYIRPSSADGGKRRSKGRRHVSASTNTGGIRKITKLFRRPKGEEIDIGHKVVPPGFYDDYEYSHRSMSPDSPFDRNRYYSLGSRTALKLRRNGKEKDEPFIMWKPCKRKCEWYSLSGRHLSIQNTHITELSKVELECLQRVAIARLQGMDISISFGILKGRNKPGKLLSSSRRKMNTDRPTTAVFGQPLCSVLDHEKTRNVNSPIRTSPPVPFPSNVSPSTPYSTTSQPHPDQPIASPEDISDNLEQLTFSASSNPSSPQISRYDSCPSDPQVPMIVQKAIHYLDNNGIKTEGIFRVPGAKARIDEIRRQFDRGENVELPEDTNPHDVACLFKEFFRSLPEPLVTKELYIPLLQTRKLPTRQQKEALSLLCLTLPRPNRDTLNELLQFLSRVALHSNDTILLDGTEESGNRMTAQNLATVLGPNIIHNELKRKNVQGSYQVTKVDPEELTSVCLVMEDMIKMNDKLFNVPAELYDTVLRNLFLVNHEAVDAILRRNVEQPETDIQDCNMSVNSGDVLRSKSSDCLEHILIEAPHSNEDIDVSFRRTRSCSDEHTLDVLMKNIEDMLNEDSPISHRRHSSNDSAMGESECVTSPCQNTDTDTGNSYRDPSMYNSVDSAISNHSSHRFSLNEALNHEWMGEFDSSFTYVPFPVHLRMSSGISVQSDSTAPSLSSPTRVHSPKFIPKTSPHYRGSLPVLTPHAVHGTDAFTRRGSPFSFMRHLRKSRSANSGKGWRKNQSKFMGSFDDNIPTYSLQRSPILSRHPLGHELWRSVDSSQKDVVTTETLKDISPRFHFVIQPSTEVLI